LPARGKEPGYKAKMVLEDKKTSVFENMLKLILRRLANRLIEATDWTFLHNET